MVKFCSLFFRLRPILIITCHARNRETWQHVYCEAGLSRYYANARNKAIVFVVFLFSEMRFKEAWTAVDIVFVIVRDFFIFFIFLFFFLQRKTLKLVETSTVHKLSKNTVCYTVPLEFCFCHSKDDNWTPLTRYILSFNYMHPQRFFDILIGMWSSPQWNHLITTRKKPWSIPTRIQMLIQHERWTSVLSQTRHCEYGTIRVWSQTVYL